MRYIEITLWNPFDKGSFSLIPKLEIWISKDGFDFDWLFISVNAYFGERL